MDTLLSTLLTNGYPISNRNSYETVEHWTVVVQLNLFGDSSRRKFSPWLYIANDFTKLTIFETSFLLLAFFIVMKCQVLLT